MVVDVSSAVPEGLRRTIESYTDLRADVYLKMKRPSEATVYLGNGMGNIYIWDVTFNVFPYYSRYASDLPTLCHMILLSGSAGHRLRNIPGTLTKALAKHFGARLLVVESLLLPGLLLHWETLR
ncbi:hypothetical protein Tco_1036342 [Tanacetum coccineum]